MGSSTIGVYGRFRFTALHYQGRRPHLTRRAWPPKTSRRLDEHTPRVCNRNRNRNRKCSAAPRLPTVEGPSVLNSKGAKTTCSALLAGRNATTSLLVPSPPRDF